MFAFGDVSVYRGLYVVQFSRVDIPSCDEHEKEKKRKKNFISGAVVRGRQSGGCVVESESCGEVESTRCYTVGHSG